MVWWPWPAGSAGASSSIGDEVEAYLAGRAFELVDDGREVPCWVQLNVLARGSVLEIRRLAATEDAAATTLDSWDYVRFRLARQVLEVAAETSGGLLEVQREVLQPLEELLLRSPDGPVTTAGTVFHLVVGALDDHRRRQLS